MTSSTLGQSLPSRYLELARACKAAYAAPIAHQHLSLDGLKFTGQKIVHGSLGRGFCRLFSNEQHVVIALRGTRERIDWKIANLRCLPVPMRGHSTSRFFAPLVHQGFQDCLYFDDKTTDKPSLDAIIDHIDVLLGVGGGNRRIVVAGHSLGGAMAILLTLKIALLRPDLASRIEEVVTFGAPAVGFGRFKKAVRQLGVKITRIVNGVDLVSFAPPAFYRHVGDEIWLREDGVEQQPTWLRRIILGRFNVTQALRDHDIKSYIKRLARSPQPAA